MTKILQLCPVWIELNKNTRTNIFGYLLILSSYINLDVHTKWFAICMYSMRLPIIGWKIDLYAISLSINAVENLFNKLSAFLINIVHSIFDHQCLWYIKEKRDGYKCLCELLNYRIWNMYFSWGRKLIITSEHFEVFFSFWHHIYIYVDLPHIESQCCHIGYEGGAKF